MDRRQGRPKIAARLLATAALCVASFSGAAHAETIGGALVKAYLNNPDINQQRAAVRVSDEGISKAQSAGLPTVAASGSEGLQSTQASVVSANPFFGGTSVTHSSTGTQPRTYGVTATQVLYSGNRIGNTVSAAESAVLGARAQLRNTEQNVLLQALTAYMDVLKNAAIVDLNKNNVDVLKEQLRQTQDRFNVGELTRTDVAQAEASLAGAQATELGAEATLAATLANYRQAVGDEPRRLAPVAPLGKQLPKTIAEAVLISQVEHPAIVASLHGVDAAELQIKISEGALLPTVSVQGQVGNSMDPSGYLSGTQVTSESVVAQVSIPIYDGGATYSGIRQAKEQLSQQELSTDLQRDKVRAAVVAAWGANANSGGIIRAARAQVKSGEVALEGVREEAKVGQRTTLDVLNAQLTLLNARVQLVTAQHDQVVNSYSLLSAIGRLSAESLGLSVVAYDPRVHFDQVRNKYFGGDTPDGK